ncbi:Trm112 family protein [Pseudotabrizicola formosa]|uniref:Trm112 family protein n=1 Tax=Pseudotabrizicola formosa TaxID=2030009 RepID=UPI000CD319D2|nr:Trm112 family protein [Pseudotabrizicola formosa]
MTDAPPRDAASSTGQTVDQRMLESLVCPVSGAVLSYDAQAQELVSKTARLAFPIRNGIPVMLVSEARPLE